MLKWPFPICQKCNKPVDKFTVKRDVIFRGSSNQREVYKCEAECHYGYEMYRIDANIIDNASFIEASIAFKRNDQYEN